MPPGTRAVKVKLDGDISGFNRAMLGGVASAKSFSSSLDTSTDRMGNLVQTSLALGPALVPITAAAIPAISGLTNQLAFAAAGAGVMAFAFQGIGTALKAVNDYQIEPTTANLEKMRESLATLGPDGQKFVQFLQELRPEIQRLQNAAQAGLFPGMEAGLTDIMNLMPRAERIVSTIATSIGDLIAEAGDNLDSPKWHEFFDFLEREARPTLMDMGRTLGNFVEGFANLWMAFAPVSTNFSKSFLNMARDFAEWTDGLDQTQGFQEFLDYIERVGPKAWDTLGALGDALLQIVEAAAPVGEVSLPIIQAVAKVLSAIADSPAGPALIVAAAGISAISRAIALYKVANGSAIAGFLNKAGGAGTAANAGMRLAAAGVGVFALSLTDLDEKMGLSNTATFALMGAVAGPWGAAIGAGVGLTMDFAHANDSLWQAVDRANSVLGDSGSSLAQQSAAVEAARKKVDELKDSVDGAFGGLTLKGQKNFYEGLFGSSDVEEAESALKKLEAQQEANIIKAQDHQFAEAGLSTAMRGASQSTRDQTQGLLDNIDALNAQRDALLGNANKQIAYEQAIDDATKAAGEGARTLDINTQAGRDNQEALLRVAGAWNDLEPAAQNAKGASERARSEFIKVAIQMGATKDQARRLADQYLDIPKKIETTVDISGVERVLNQIERMNRAAANSNRKIHYTAGYGGGQTRADGGYISGPGGPRDDLIPAWLSDGEFVVNAAATKENLGLLHEINSRKYAAGGYVLPKFADGGRLDASRMQPFRQSSSQSSGSSAPIALDGLSGQLTITNWETGEGRFQLIADDAASRALAQSQRSAAGSRSTRGVNR